MDAADLTLDLGKHTQSVESLEPSVDFVQGFPLLLFGGGGNPQGRIYGMAT